MRERGRAAVAGPPPLLAALRSRAASLCLDSADLVARLLGPPLVLLAVALALGFSAAFLRLVAPAYGGLSAAAPLLAAAAKAAAARVPAGANAGAGGDAAHATPPLVLLPLVLAASWRSALLALAWLFAAANFAINYCVCALCEPGFAPAAYQRQLRLLAALDPAAAAQPPQRLRDVALCRECGDAPKPRRFHHCSVCGRCVAKLDHHCPWLNNCVGARTYASFVRLLFWTWVCCALLASFGLPVLLDVRKRCNLALALPQHADATEGPAPGAFAFAAAAAAAAGAPRLLAESARKSLHTLMQQQLQFRTGAQPQPSLAAAAPADAAAAAAGSHAPWPHKYLDFRGLFLLVVRGARCAYERLWLDGPPAATGAPGGGCNELLPLAWALSVCVGLCVAALLAWHAYLVLTAQTSMEALRTAAPPRPAGAEAGAGEGGAAGASCCGAAGAGAGCCCPAACGAPPGAKTARPRNIYDFGWRRNVQAVFGSQSLVSWVLPPSWIGLAGAGDGTGPSMAELAGCCGAHNEPSEPAARPVREVFAALSSEFASDLTRAAAGLRAGAAVPPAAAKDGSGDRDEEAGSGGGSARSGGGGGGVGGGGGRRVA